MDDPSDHTNCPTPADCISQLQDERAALTKKAQIAESALSVLRDHARLHGYAALADIPTTALADARDAKVYKEGEAQGFRNARQQWIDSAERATRLRALEDALRAVKADAATAGAFIEQEIEKLRES